MNDKQNFVDANGISELSADQFVKNIPDRNKDSFVERHGLKYEASFNVMNKQELRDRFNKLLNYISEFVSNSLGPYGSGTILCRWPETFVSKDGFNILSNISTDCFVDRCLFEIIFDASTRLNNMVGDATTTVCVAIAALYDSFIKNAEEFDKIPPRKLIKAFERNVKTIVSELEKRSKKIDISDSEKLYNDIKKIALISTNNDEEISEIIADCYKQLKHPSIRISKQDSDKTEVININGIEAKELTLIDKSYLVDNNIMELDNIDVIILNTSINNVSFRNIIRPLHVLSHMRGRKLLVIATDYNKSFVESDLKNYILDDQMNDEKQITKEPSIIFTLLVNKDEQQHQHLKDLEIILNTHMIVESDVKLISSILNDPKFENIDLATTMDCLFTVDNRNIKGLTVNNAIIHKDDIIERIFGSIGDMYDDKVIDLKMIKDRYNSMCFEDGSSIMEFLNNVVRPSYKLGYVEHAELKFSGNSFFSGFHYDENLYNRMISEAERDLNESIEKYKNAGRFNMIVYRRKNRLLSLKFNMMEISLCGTSMIDTQYKYELLEDAVKACESAYNNGIVLGCMVDTQIVIKNLLNNKDVVGIDRDVLTMIANALRTVHSKVIHMEDNIDEKIDDCISREMVYQIDDNGDGEYTTDVITSYQTDVEVLSTIVSILSKIIPANQLIIKDAF